MTKFILHGGVARKKSVSNDNYHKEIIKGLKSPIKILDITFAKKKKYWHESYIKDKLIFLRIIKNKQLLFTLASEKLDQLKKQIKENDVIYIIGGEETLCLKRMIKLKNLKNLLKGKVVAGSSAGAYVLSRYYYTRLRSRVENGLGILPVKTIAHYDKVKSAVNLKRLRNTGDNLKIYKIPETYYKVIKTNN